MPRNQCSKAAVKLTAVTLLTAPLPLLVVLGSVFLSSPVETTTVRDWSPVARVSSLPADGTPAAVAVYVPQYDAWTRKPDRLAGRLFLRRLPRGNGVIALRADHSPYRIPVEFDRTKRRYRSSCWDVHFDLDGRLISDGRPGRAGAMEPISTRIVGDTLYARRPS